MPSSCIFCIHIFTIYLYGWYSTDGPQVVLLGVFMWFREGRQLVIWQTSCCSFINDSQFIFSYACTCHSYRLNWSLDSWSEFCTWERTYARPCSGAGSTTPSLLPLSCNDFRVANWFFDTSAITKFALVNVMHEHNYAMWSKMRFFHWCMAFFKNLISETARISYHYNSRIFYNFLK